MKKPCSNEDYILFCVTGIFLLTVVLPTVLAFIGLAGVEMFQPITKLVFSLR